jgi:pimeloyl-ACP methyl ester carboxylesterase
VADVFVSYATEDRSRTTSLIKRLQDAGLTVWWDRRIDPGTSFDKIIEQELSAASCVLVVWSKTSVSSDWVREEAEDGLRRGILVPVQIDECQIPLGFRRVQAVNLTGWPRSRQDLCILVDRIGALVKKEPIDASPRKRKTWRRPALIRLLVGGIGGIIVLLGAYLYRGPFISAVVMNAPGMFFGEPIAQELGVATAADGTKIAYAVAGSGPPLVYVLGWMTHLKEGFNSPLYDNERLLSMTSNHHRFVRYDGRGFGMSDRNVEDLSIAARVSDLKAVVDALGLERFAILAASSGGPLAIIFAAQHPERVSGLVLASTFASTSWVSEEDNEAAHRFWDFAEMAWAQPPVSDMFAGITLAPTGNAIEQAVLGSLLRRCCDGPNVASYFRINLGLDVRQQARQIKVPTLVIHARDDQAVSFEGGKELASLISQSRFEVVEGGHREGTASTAEVRQLALDFLATLD